MADDKKKLGDYIELKLPAFGNQVATIYRADTTEEQWQMAKAAAKESGTLHTLKESEKAGMSGGSAKPSSADVLELRDPMTGVVAKMPRGDISERRWKALKEQVAKGDTKLDWQQNKETAQPEATPVAAPKPVQAAPAAPQSHRTISGAGVTLTPDEPQASGPRKFFGDAMLGATPGAGGGAAPMSTPAPGPGAPSMDGGVASPDAGVPMSLPPAVTPSPIGVSGGAAPDAGVPAPSMALSSPPPDSSSGPMPDMGLGQPQPLTNPVDLAVAKGLPQASGTPPMSGPSTPAPGPMAVDPNATGMKVGTKTATTTPGNGNGGLEADLNRAYADNLRAKKDLAQQEAQQALEQAQLEVGKAKSLQIAEQARAAKAQSMLDAQNQLVQAQMKVAESLGEALKVDPKRLWNNRTAEQKANARLAGFLFGLSGSGADYVRGLQAEVQKDIDTQIQQFEANRAAKVAQFNAYGNIFGQYQQMGLDAATSAKAAQASILDVHASKLKELEFKYKGTTAGARAAEAGAALGVVRVAGLNELRDSAAQRASLYEARRLQQLDIEAKLEARKAKAVGGSGAMPAVLKEDVQRIQDVLAGVRAMKKAASGGFFARGAVSAATASPLQVGPIADLAARQNTYTTQRSELLKSVLGALTKEDYRQADSMIPEKISAGVDPSPYFDQLEAFVQDRLNRRLSGDIGSYTSATAADTRGPSSASNYGFSAE